MKEKKCQWCGKIIKAHPNTYIEFNGTGTALRELQYPNVAYTYYCDCGVVIKATEEDYK